MVYVENLDLAALANRCSNFSVLNGDSRDCKPQKTPRYISHIFNFGERCRLAIVALLAIKSDVFVLDESFA